MDLSALKTKMFSTTCWIIYNIWFSSDECIKNLPKREWRGSRPICLHSQAVCLTERLPIFRRRFHYVPNILETPYSQGMKSFLCWLWGYFWFVDTASCSLEITTNSFRMTKAVCSSCLLDCWEFRSLCAFLISSAERARLRCHVCSEKPEKFLHQRHQRHDVAHAHTKTTWATSCLSRISLNSLLCLHKSKMWWYICHHWIASNCFNIGLALK